MEVRIFSTAPVSDLIHIDAPASIAAICLRRIVRQENGMIIVAGTFVLKPGTLDALKPDAERMIAASRAEPGCRVYSYGVDVVDPAVIRVYEEWESRDHLDAHFQTDHMKTWRSRLAEVGIERRDITMWEASSPVAV